MAYDGPPETVPDVLEGRPDPPVPRGRWIVGAVAIALAGVAVGYLWGDHRSTASSSHPAPITSTSAQPAASTATGFGPSLYQTGASCSLQRGHRLQLGVQIANQSSSVLVLTRVESREPLGGLRQIAGRPGPCGQIAGAVPVDEVVPPTVPPGGTIWVTVTAQVQRSCPTGFPVQFVVHYLQGGHPRSQQLPGFLDLGHVPYSGCASQGPAPR